MKKISFILVAFIILCSVSCKKSTTDTPVDVTYTVKYSVVSTGNVTVDTIIYMNYSGVEETLLGQARFTHSFESENGYHGKLYVSGTTVNGSCSYGLIVLTDGGIYYIDSTSTSSSQPLHFHYLAESSKSGN